MCSEPLFDHLGRPVIYLCGAKKGSIPKDIEFPRQQLAALLRGEAGDILNPDPKCLRERHRRDIASESILVLDDTSMPAPQSVLLRHPGLLPADRQYKRPAPYLKQSTVSEVNERPLEAGRSGPAGGLLQLLLDQPIDLTAVGAAFGLSHYGADYGSYGLAVAFADLLYGVGVFGHCLFDYGLQLA